MIIKMSQEDYDKFMKIAEENNAILSPEETERIIKKNNEINNRYEIHTSWLGNLFVVDTKSIGYKIWSFIFYVLLFITFILILFGV
jgi:hypothetical protein